jgi:hypothetical protein
MHTGRDCPGTFMARSQNVPRVVWWWVMVNDALGCENSN